MSFVEGIAINHLCATERKPGRHQCAGTPHGRVVLLLTRHKLPQFAGQQRTNAAATLCGHASSPLKEISVNGYGDVVLA
jgi:hypothetical protein